LQNIEKAQKEIERLEAEEDAAAGSNGVNGKSVSDVTSGLKDASISDKKDEVKA
jgi:hypothetical protein